MDDSIVLPSVKSTAAILCKALLDGYGRPVGRKWKIGNSHCRQLNPEGIQHNGYHLYTYGNYT